MRFDSYGAVIIGGGFYGCFVAIELRKYFHKVLLLEKEDQLLERSSYNNQARVHQGYHYPRSILTSLRSRVNFTRFVAEYEPAVVQTFDTYYAIARTLSKIRAGQFKLFCDRIGAPISPAPDDIKAMFNPHQVEDAFTVLEYVFNAAKLREIMKRRLAEAGVECEAGAFVEKLRPAGNACQVEFSKNGEKFEVSSQYVFNCGYSLINGVLSRSGLPMIPMKHEFAEMALIEVPDSLRNKGMTIMDGPFFAIMPFPDRNLHTLHHVRYTPHHWWMDTPGGDYLDARQHFLNCPRESRYAHMIKDSIRYIPALEGASYVESLWELKSVLPRSEVDDSRPILFRPIDQAKNVICILGGKIDNVFDIQDCIRNLFDVGEKA